MKVGKEKESFEELLMWLVEVSGREKMFITPEKQAFFDAQHKAYSHMLRCLPEFKGRVFSLHEKE